MRVAINYIARFNRSRTNFSGTFVGEVEANNAIGHKSTVMESQTEGTPLKQSEVE